MHERFFIEIREGDDENLSYLVSNTFGISWFAAGHFLKGASLKDAEGFVFEIANRIISPDSSYKLQLQRSDKSGEGRDEIINTLAKRIERKVDLKNPTRTLFIEKLNEGWLVFAKKINGHGGLPSGTQGKVLALISGGIDSPVAAYMLAKRGAEIIWLHFHSFPVVSLASMHKTEELGEIFLRFQPKLKIYNISLAPIQLAVKMHAPQKYRVLLYRRAMYKIAEHIAECEGAGALVTGESLGQVASQTLSNLAIVQSSVKIPIFRPLIGLNKQEIINMANVIGTYNISTKPQEDCCSLFVPKHPTADGKLKDIVKAEKDITFNKLIKQCLKNLEIKIKHRT